MLVQILSWRKGVLPNVNTENITKKCLFLYSTEESKTHIPGDIVKGKAQFCKSHMEFVHRCEVLPRFSITLRSGPFLWKVRLPFISLFLIGSLI